MRPLTVTTRSGHNSAAPAIDWLGLTVWALCVGACAIFWAGTAVVAFTLA